LRFKVQSSFIAVAVRRIVDVEIGKIHVRSVELSGDHRNIVDPEWEPFFWWKDVIQVFDIIIGVVLR
jgi:hypothetical protein